MSSAVAAAGVAVGCGCADGEVRAPLRRCRPQPLPGPGSPWPWPPWLAWGQAHPVGGSVLPGVLGLGSPVWLALVSMVTVGPGAPQGQSGLCILSVLGEAFLVGTVCLAWVPPARRRVAIRDGGALCLRGPCSRCCCPGGGL